MADGKKIETQDIHLTFPKKNTRAFTSKAGDALVSVSIPNADINDKRPWETFIVKAGNIHDSQDGKNVYTYISAKGETKLNRRVVTGQDENGKRIYGAQETRTVSNAELKSLIEAAKEKSREAVAGEHTHAQPHSHAQSHGKERHGISITFSKKLMGEKFKAKDDKVYVQVKIPNVDTNDSRAWETFLLPADMPRENASGKSMYVYLPESGKTRLERQEFAGRDENGKGIFQKSYRTVSNAELKTLVEAYREKSRDSVLSNLAEKKAEVAEKAAPAARDEKNYSQIISDKPHAETALQL